MTNEFNLKAGHSKILKFDNRINPDDVSKSLIKPSDFPYLNKNESVN